MHDGNLQTIPHGSYVNKSAAFSSGLVYVQDDGVVIMKADDFTKLPKGTFRNR